VRPLRRPPGLRQFFVFLEMVQNGVAIMLNVLKISKSYGVDTLLDEVSFVVNPSERVALIGANGSGKTTLLRIIAGDLNADHGTVALPPNARLGWLRQDLEPAPGETVGQAVRAGLGEWQALRVKVEQLADRMASVQGEALAAVMAAYDRALAEFQSLGGYEVDHRVKSTLASLGLVGIDLEIEVTQLSGGEQTRVGLAAVLIAQPEMLLLDEPTNHLDIKALEWLEGWLNGFRGAVLLVSHDRTFLDRTVSRVLELENGVLTEYAGNYSAYLSEKATARERQWAAWKDQEDEIRRIRGDIHRTKMHAKSVELTTTSRDPGVRRYAKKVAKKAISREKKLDRFLNSDERVEKPQGSWGMRLEFDEELRSGKRVLELRDIGHKYDHWLYRHVDLTLSYGERVALLGPNGSGKSTLLRSIVGENEPIEGAIEIGANVRLGYMPQKQEILDGRSTPFSVVRAAAEMTETETRSFLHYFLFAGDEVFRKVGALSYGERARLLLAKLVAEGANCLLLDEPVNHLDIPSRERFEGALAAFPGAILAAIHDRAFIDRFATAVWALEGGTVRRYLDREEMISNAAGEYH
jgi:ATP-binding cassette subfamily F protein 3